MKKYLVWLALLMCATPAFAQNSPGSVSADISGTVATGGTYQTVAAQNSLRKNCTVQNPTGATENLNVKLGTMAQPYVLGPGQSFSTANGWGGATDVLTVTATTQGHAFAGTCQ